MRTVCIVQARTGSTRLPGKVLLPLNGRTVIGEVLTRCKRIRGIDEVVCAVPYDDNELQREATKYGLVFTGPEHDVLTRYYKAAQWAAADIVMRVTGDCPHICPEVCTEVLTLIRKGAAYASNLEPRTFPQGLDCEAFMFSTLTEAHLNASRDQREHVTTWMRENVQNRANFAAPWKMDGRLTLDTEDDYRVICAAFGHQADECVLSSSGHPGPVRSVA